MVSIHVRDDTLLGSSLLSGGVGHSAGGLRLEKLHKGCVRRIKVVV